MRRFLALWGGQALSLIGSQAVQFALIWWLTRTSESATVLAVATLLGLLPPVVLGPLIGVLIDRWDRRVILLVADGGVAAASLALAALFAAGQVEREHVLALLLVRALGAAFHAPAMLASTSLMVPAPHLTRIQGLEQALHGLLNIVAAPLGAALLGVLPMAGVVLVDVGTALFGMAPLLVIGVPRPPCRRAQAGQAWRAVLADLAAGFAYLWRRPGHRTLVGMSTFINMCLIPAFSLLPLLVLERLGRATELAWMSSAMGCAILAGGALLGAWGGFRRRILTTLAGLPLLGGAVMLLGSTPPGALAWGISAMVGVGLAIPMVNGPVIAILQATVAPEYQGRVFTLMGSLSGAAAPLGLLVAAPIAERVGVEAWYLAGGAVCMAMGAAGFLFPSLLHIEETA